MKNIVLGLTVLSCIIFLTSGCQTTSKEEKNTQLTILAEDSQQVRQNWIEPYQLVHPDVKINILDLNTIISKDEKKINDPIHAMVNIIKENPIDIAFLRGPELTTLVNENLLVELDPLMKQDNFDFNNYADIVKTMISVYGNGKTYGLAPFFNSFGLVYNKKIFSSLNIDPPSDHENWDDLVQKAEAISKRLETDGIYGLDLPQPDPFDALGIFTYANELSLVQEDGNKMVVNTPSWKKVWGQVADLYSKKIVFTPMVAKKQGIGPNFGNNKVGMAIYDYSRIIQGGFNNKDEYGVASLPYFSDNKEGLNITLFGLSGIISNSTHIKESWDLLKFINSEGVAKVKSQNLPLLTSRSNIMHDDDFSNKFYDYKVTYNQRESIHVDTKKISKIAAVGSELLNQTIQGRITTDEALKEFEEKGQEILVTPIK
ncbi:extracellular solute-binding protein [Paenibacillus alba]|uniref:ABC transporter substrate-binding protein n=1 Tax=Paenibacillus alba TaxID=1197127 RepID=UPI0015655B3C|nr:extracellular solute-binding protein [Paenibacillus alba]NQX67829.1 extracellular solute-binding protein [Paenibacillus alba]